VAAPGGAAIIPRINELAEAVRRSGGLVIHTVHVVRPDGSTTGVMGEFNAAIKAGLLHKGRHSAELHRSLEVADSDLLVEKPRYGAFYGTDIELILRNRGIETVIVTGITTNVCCETTAREANMRDFQVFFISDGTANVRSSGCDGRADPEGSLRHPADGLCTGRDHRVDDHQAALQRNIRSSLGLEAGRVHCARPRPAFAPGSRRGSDCDETLGFTGCRA